MTKTAIVWSDESVAFSPYAYTLASPSQFQLPSEEAKFGYSSGDKMVSKKVTGASYNSRKTLKQVCLSTHHVLTSNSGWIQGYWWIRNGFQNLPRYIERALLFPWMKLIRHSLMWGSWRDDKSTYLKHTGRISWLEWGFGPHLLWWWKVSNSLGVVYKQFSDFSCLDMKNLILNVFTCVLCIAFSREKVLS